MWLVPGSVSHSLCCTINLLHTSPQLMSLRGGQGGQAADVVLKSLECCAAGWSVVTGVLQLAQ